MNVLAIDPGTKTGWTMTDGVSYETGLWNLKTKAKTKKSPAEPKYYRLSKLWGHLGAMHAKYKVDTIVCEGAAGFMRGKAAIEASHKFRAVIELFCAIYEVELVMIEPNDLKFFALGKRSGEKAEMIAAANRLGYEGNDDNEADSFLAGKWYVAKYIDDRPF